MAIIRFQCPECGYGDYEIGHLVIETEFHCVVCLEEHGLQVQVQCWEERETALLTTAPASAD